MIQNADTIKALRDDWAGVVRLRERVGAGFLSSLMHGSFHAASAADAAHNLPMIFAFGVLKDALGAMHVEKLFTAAGRYPTLGALMDGSDNKIPWLHFDRMKAAVKRRNEVAHDGVLLPRDECMQNIDAIERELANWRIL